jgi:hypothetical protein
MGMHHSVVLQQPSPSVCVRWQLQQLQQGCLVCDLLGGWKSAQLHPLKELAWWGALLQPLCATAAATAAVIYIRLRARSLSAL